MQNCNLSRSLQFLRLDTHLTSVKWIVTVVNLKMDVKSDVNAHNNYEQ